MRGAFGSQVGGEGLGVGDAGEVGAFEDVLVVGFGGEEEGGSFGTAGRYTKQKKSENLVSWLDCKAGKGGGDRWEWTYLPLVAAA